MELVRGRKGCKGRRGNKDERARQVRPDRRGTGEIRGLTFGRLVPEEGFSRVQTVIESWRPIAMTAFPARFQH